MFGIAIWVMIGIVALLAFNLFLILAVAGMFGLDKLLGRQGSRIAFVLAMNAFDIWIFNLLFAFKDTFTIVLCAIVCIGSTGPTFVRLLKNDYTHMM